MAAPHSRSTRATVTRLVAGSLAATLAVGVLVAGSDDLLAGPAPAVAAPPDVEGDRPVEARPLGGAQGQDVAPTFPVSQPGPQAPTLVASSLWWTWEAPESGPVSFSTAGSELDTELTVRSGSETGPVVATNDDDGDVTTSAVDFDAEAGTTYLIEVGTRAEEPGLVTLSWQSPTAPAAAPAPEAGASAETTAAGYTASEIPLVGNTGEKPQSKVWRAHDTWWVVLASASTSPAGTWVWRYDTLAATWTAVTRISDRTDVRADVKPLGDTVHVLLHGPQTSLVSLQYVASDNSYAPWSARTTPTVVALPGSETATIDVDTTGRMWLASDTSTSIQVRWSDAPYTTFSAPVTVASGVTDDDIGLVTRLAGGRIGVLWSDQNTDLWGFRTHVDGTSPSTWTADEQPAKSSAIKNLGTGMSDDHLNVALASDGTLYAAVKTSYDDPSAATIALLVRRPNGTWDPLHEVDRRGTRPVVQIDEATRSLRVTYTASVLLDDILAKEVSLDDLDFSDPAQVILSGTRNNVTSTKDPTPGASMVVASSATTTGTALLPWTVQGAPKAQAATVSTTTGTPVSGVLTATGVSGTPEYAVVDAPAHGTVVVTNAATGAYAYTPAADRVGPDAFTFRVRSGDAWSAPARVDVAVTSEPGIRGAWDLDETTGLSAADTSGWAHPAALSGGASWVTGVAGNALRLDGSTGKATVPDTAALDVSSALTVSAWVRPEKTGTQYLVKKADGGRTDGYELSIASTGKPFLRLNERTSGNTYRVDAPTAIPANGTTWTHLTGTYDGTTLRLYVNGSQVATLAGPARIATNDLPLLLGNQPAGDYPYKGALDAVRIYDRALTAAQVTALATGVTPPAPAPVAQPGTVSTTAGAPVSGVLTATGVSGTPEYAVVDAPAHGTVVVTNAATGAFAYTPAAGRVGPDAFTFRVRVGTTWSAPARVDVAVTSEPGIRGAWDLDETSGLSAADTSGWAHPATLSGGATWVAGVAGNALRLDGSAGKATVPDTSALDVSGPLTLSAWVRPEKTGTQYLVKKADGGRTDGYELSIASTGKPFFRLNERTSGNTYRVDAPGVIPANGTTWTHLTGTYDGTTMRLYVDGTQVSAVTGPAQVATNDLPLLLGNQPAGDYPYKGALDAVRIYDRALTAAQVTALAAPAGQTPDGPGTDPTDPTDPPTDPTDPPTDPTEPTDPTDPTDPPTEPTDPPTEPTDPPATPPTVQDLGLTTVAATAAEGTVLGGGTADALEVVTAPASGTAQVVDAAAGTVRYVPAPGFVGEDTFTVRARSGTAWSAPATVTVRVLLAAGLRGAWELDETSGLSAADTSGWARPATVSGGATWVAGVAGNALRLDGTGRATVADAPGLDLTDALTLDAWVRPGRTATQYIVKKADGYRTDGYELAIASTGKPFFRLNERTSGNTYRVDAPSVIPADGTTWTHLTATYDGATMRLYVNGSQVSTVAGPARIATNDLPLVLGDQPSGGYPFTGTLDRIRVYDRALSPAEITALSTGTAP